MKRDLSRSFTCPGCGKPANLTGSGFRFVLGRRRRVCAACVPKTYMKGAT